MNAETTLRAVRELSERATIRPAGKRLRLAKPAEIQTGPKRAVVAYEELHPSVIGGVVGRASGQKSRKPREFKPAIVEKDFMAAALEKTAA